MDRPDSNVKRVNYTYLQATWYCWEYQVAPSTKPRSTHAPGLTGVRAGIGLAGWGEIVGLGGFMGIGGRLGGKPVVGGRVYLRTACGDGTAPEGIYGWWHMLASGINPPESSESSPGAGHGSSGGSAAFRGRPTRLGMGASAINWMDQLGWGCVALEKLLKPERWLKGGRKELQQLGGWEPLYRPV